MKVKLQLFLITKWYYRMTFSDAYDLKVQPVNIMVLMFIRATLCPGRFVRSFWEGVKHTTAKFMFLWMSSFENLFCFALFLSCHISRIVLQIVQTVNIPINILKKKILWSNKVKILLVRMFFVLHIFCSHMVPRVSLESR